MYIGFMNLYNKSELAICGFSGSGKTTLIQSLIKELSTDFFVGYAKHDAHYFEMDRPGKDTYVAKKAGAKSVFISNKDQYAFIGQGQLEENIKRNLFNQCDFVLVEGHKKTEIPKIVLIDEEMKIMELIKQNEITNVLALCGERIPQQGPGNLPFFNRNDILSIQKFILEKLKKRPSF
tara:strand:+ start:447 stop:980 length:534 start_codon:yes stop_codon:yes gene_type:complete